MMPRRIILCQDRSTGWAKVVVTRAWVVTALDLVFRIMFVVPITVILPPFAL